MLKSKIIFSGKGGIKLISEFVLAGALVYGYDRYKNRNLHKIKNNFLKITYRIPELINRQTELPKIVEINKESYGYTIVISLPWGITSETFEKLIPAYKEGLKLDSLHYESDKGISRLHCIEKYIYNTYIPQKLPAHCIFIGDGLTKNIIVDMNKFPHVLIGGDTGSGKSRLLLVILTNLIRYSNANIYLLQVRKNDLGVFQNCRQVKRYSKRLDEVRDCLVEIDKELQRREKLIDNTRGIYNIEDYNKTAEYKLKYTYVIIEEFSFLNLSRGDDKVDKNLKLQCMKYIKNLVNVGRSSGVFMVTSLQKPTNDSIPSDIKAQLTTRLSLTIKDKATSIVIMGDGSAAELKEREFICRTLNTEKGYTITINHDIVMENIKDRLIDKTPSIAPKSIEIVDSTEEDILKRLNEITG